MFPNHDRLFTATDWLRPPCRMCLTMGDAAIWCPMRTRTCRSHIKPTTQGLRVLTLSASSLVSKTTKHPITPAAICVNWLTHWCEGGKPVPLREHLRHSRALSGKALRLRENLPLVLGLAN